LGPKTSTAASLNAAGHDEERRRIRNDALQLGRRCRLAGAFTQMCGPEGWPLVADGRFDIE